MVYNLSMKKAFKFINIAMYVFALLQTLSAIGLWLAIAWSSQVSNGHGGTRTYNYYWWGIPSMAGVVIFSVILFVISAFKLTKRNEKSENIWRYMSYISIAIPGISTLYIPLMTISHFKTKSIEKVKFNIIFNVILNSLLTIFLILYVIAKIDGGTKDDSFYLTSMLGTLISGFFAFYYGLFFAIFIYRNYPTEGTLMIFTFFHIPIASSVYQIYKYNKISDSLI